MTTSGVSKKLMLNVQMVCLALIVISSPVYANLIRNGDFATGDFADWTLFTTAHGSLGVGPLPRITLFDVSGTSPTIAAEFQVGQVILGPRAGGGIEQIVTTDAGLYRFRADIAAFSTRVDPDAGNVSVLVDNISEDTVNFGPINSKPPFMPLLRGPLRQRVAPHGVGKPGRERNARHRSSHDEAPAISFARWEIHAARVRAAQPDPAIERCNRTVWAAGFYFGWG